MLLSEQRQLKHNLSTILKGIVSLFREPTNLDYVYDIEDGLRNTKATSLAVEFMKSQPGVAQLIEERYLAPTPDIESLLKYPEDTLGYTYAAYIKTAGFDANFYRNVKVEDENSYILLRIRQTHDIWHIVTGFGTDGLGELGLKAFELAQTRRNLAVVLVGGGLLIALVKSPEGIGYLLDHIAMGYRMGSKAKPLLAQKWEEHWDKPLSEWRAELGLEPASVYTP
ncbi:Coq4 family protein [Mastigocladopsis repens]|uniref:Coq4 family protein n=1 Tax=Mastigocladopsis repens TaxID=221287 RepID=UPI0002D8DE63|nr:Coq4 family protein [Mastigocladopsis repens]